MSIDSVSQLRPGAPRIEDFTHAAQDGGDVYLSVSGEQLRVLATGTTPSGRQVAWVDPSLDTAQIFSRALADTYGNGIASAVSHELGLQAGPGKPLSARTVERAVDMAETSRVAMTGVDFATQLACSAVSGSAAFNDACRQAGIDPAAITPAQRQAVDTAMRERFDAAAASGLSPVSGDTARGWLRELVS